MEEKLIYGKPIADRTNMETKAFIDEMKKQGKRCPKVNVVLANDSPASLSYISGFEKLCASVGMAYTLTVLKESVSQQELNDVLDTISRDDETDGILLQMPLPKQINADEAILHIDPNKDLDGFHPMNVGKLWMNQPTFVPCTAESVMAFIEASGIDLKGKHVVVLGRSNVVGKPVAELCLAAHATVTICHSRTVDIEKEASRADVLIAAIGKARLIKSDWIKPGAVVIDVGVNRDENGKLCGDVDFDDVIDKVGKISPVPKGVGVVTNAMLLHSAITAYKMKETGKNI